ncbi:MAG: RHS repeat-associated core domain-containing protein, partial [Candidatus Sulfotelmatobacter sp.]
DGSGLRASQTIAGTTSHLTWDTSGSLPLLISDGANSYIYGPGDLPIEQISSKGTPTYYHHDQLGSTRMLTNSSGNKTATFTYGAYGSLIGSAGTQTTPLGYAGQYTNAESGLQYLRARVYDPRTGQFLTQDDLMPITHLPYGYAQDNPLNYRDPTGFLTLGVCVSLSGSIIGSLGLGGSGCVQASTSGDVGVTATAGPPTLGTPGLSGGPGVEITNAEHVSQLAGPFYGGGGSAVDGLGIHGQAFVGEDNCGNIIGGVIAGPAFGAGVAGTAGPSETIQASISLPSVLEAVEDAVGKFLEAINPF